MAVLAAAVVVAVVVVVHIPVVAGAGQSHHVPHVKFATKKATRLARFVASLFRVIFIRSLGEWLALLLLRGPVGTIVIIIIVATVALVAAVLAAAAMAAMAVSGATTVKVAPAAMVG